MEGFSFDSLSAFLAWCIGTDRTVQNGTTYTAKAYSSYDLDLIHRLGLVENTVALPMVNWILNQSFVDTVAPGGLGTFTYGDVQASIWDLIGDARSAGLGPISEARITYLKTQASAHGLYIPGKDGVVGVVLVVLR